MTTPRKPVIVRWWMIVLCLLVCWLCWWAVSRLLAPQALWSLASPNGRYTMPVMESQDGRLLLSYARNFSTQARHFGEGLVIQDTATGATLHRSQGPAHSIIEKFGNELSPHLLSQRVYWLTDKINDEDQNHEYRLHFWDYETGRVHTCQPVWKGNMMETKWPAHSRVILFTRYAPWEVYLLGACAPGNAFMFGLLHRFEYLPRAAWHESWELPVGEEQEPRMLARWPLPNQPWQGVEPHLSQDGRWVIYSEPLENFVHAYQRTRQHPKTEYTARELASFFRVGTPGLQVFDTRTGQRRFHLNEDHVVYQHNQSSHGDHHLIIRYPLREQAMIARKDLGLVDSEWIVNPFTHLMEGSCEVYRMTEEGITRLLPQDGLALENHERSIFKQGRLHLHQYVEQRLHEFQIEGNRYRIRQTWDLPEHAKYRCDPLPRGNQGVARVLPIRIPEFLSKWMENSPNLHEWVYKFWRKLQPENQFAVLDFSHAGVREHRLINQYHHDIPHATHLYSLEYERVEESEIKQITLHAYQLPMVIYSPWWARLAGLFPLVVLMIYWRWKRLSRSV
jgi:hypothetical protein